MKLHTLQRQAHQNQLLIACIAGAEALGVAAVFYKAELFVQGKGAGVVGDHVQFQLGVASFAGAVDAGGSQRLADAKAPILLSDADAKLGAVLQLIKAADSADPGGAGHATVYDGKNFYPVGALGLSLQIFALLRGGEGGLLRVGQQVVRFCVGQDEIVQCGLAVSLGAVAQAAGRAVFQLDDLMIGYGTLLGNTGLTPPSAPYGIAGCTAGNTARAGPAVPDGCPAPEFCRGTAQ